MLLHRIKFHEGVSKTTTRWGLSEDAYISVLVFVVVRALASSVAVARDWSTRESLEAVKLSANGIASFLANFGRHS